MGSGNTDLDARGQLRSRGPASPHVGPWTCLGLTWAGTRTGPLPRGESNDAFAPTDAADRSNLIRNMLILRALAGDDSLGQVETLVEREHARFIAIGEIRAALPRHQSILRADIEQRLNEIPPTQATKVREDISRFLDEHPATARALSGENSPTAPNSRF